VHCSGNEFELKRAPVLGWQAGHITVHGSVHQLSDEDFYSPQRNTTDPREVLSRIMNSGPTPNLQLGDDTSERERPIALLHRRCVARSRWIPTLPSYAHEEESDERKAYTDEPMLSGDCNGDEDPKGAGRVDRASSPTEAADRSTSAAAPPLLGGAYLGREAFYFATFALCFHAL
jgi:hypothetical protein